MASKVNWMPFFYSASNFSISSVIFSGFIVEPYRCMGFPFRSNKNFVKFHFISLANVPGSCVFKNL